MANQQDEQKLIDLMRDFRDAMLVTRHSEQSLAARPMAVAEVSDDGSVWFVTDNRSEKIEELLTHHEVLVTMQASNRYVSLSGHGEVRRDKQRVEELWSEAWKVWFPDGPDDPTLVLLRVVPTFGQFWDNSGFQGIKYLFEAGRAYVSGTRPDTDSSQHGEVRF